MAHAIPARLTAAEGRRFGLAVGAALGLLAAVLWWRGRLPAGAVALVMGVILLGLGALAPTRLGPAYRAWMGLAGLLSRVTTPIFLGIVYFVAITPTAVLRRRFGRDPIGRARNAPSWWVRHTGDQERSGMEHQF